MTLIRLQRAAFGYTRRPVVAGVDLEVRAGRFFGIVGPNGAGKTTLFRGILGLLKPLAGSVERSGVVIGYVPQRETLDALYPLTAQEVVEMGAYRRLSGLRAVTRADRDASSAMLVRVGLGEQRAARFSALSGGQRQRALIARALMTKPNVLLLDEPTSGVDRAAQARILALLRELHREGLAILLVSHHLSMVRESVDEVLWVSRGTVRHGSPSELLKPEQLDELFETEAAPEEA
ncbi:MAG: metal ABC transporter ATP-binding protein [Planctomycetes bacterium]|nr:metal ABC transporter ATP-binding protein [Planctomycetota bacterium]